MIDMSPFKLYSHLENVRNYQPFSTQELGHEKDDQAEPVILAPGGILKGTGFRMIDFNDFEMRAGFWDSAYRFTGPRPSLPDMSLSPEDVIRYKMSWRAIKNLTGSGQKPLRYYEQPKPPIHRCKDWPGFENTLQASVSFGFITVAFIYGGLHALAWFAHFGSLTQQLLWRISTCVVMGGIPTVYVLLAFPVKMTGDFPKRWRYRLKIYRPRHFENKLKCLRHYISLISASLVLLVYTFARLYLVVECFINLSHLPAGVYEVPSWSAYFPHIS